MNSNLQNANDAVFYYTVRLSVYIFHKNLYLRGELANSDNFYTREILNDIANFWRNFKFSERSETIGNDKKKQQLTGGEMEYENS